MDLCNIKLFVTISVVTMSVVTITEKDCTDITVKSR